MENKESTSFEKKITIGSLFDGSGGFPLAGALNGVIPLWASEIEPYPIAVTRSRFPNMKHLGSVTDIRGGDIEPVDIITFGSPCQDMSIAGKRAGMQHESKGDEDTTRSGLFYEAVRIIREMRETTNGKYPKYAIWENVPGAFTSNKGEDFRFVLQELAQVSDWNVSIPQPKNGRWNNAGEIVGNGFSIAWRVLDAQYWGVPQRRKRIYLVADFNSDSAGKILFELESVPRNPPQSREAREEIAANAEKCIDGSCQSGCLNPSNSNLSTYCIDKSAVVYDTTQITCPTNHSNPKVGDPCHTLSAHQHPPLVVRGIGCSFDDGKDHVNCLNPLDCQSKRQYSIDGVYRTLDAGQSSGGQAHGVVYSIDALSSNSMKSANPNSGFHETECAKCLDTSGCNPTCNQGGNVVVTSFIEYRGDQSYSFVYDCRGNGDGNVVPTLTGDHENRVTDYTAVCVTENDVDDKATAVTLHGNCVSGTLMARDYKGVGRWDTLGSIICIKKGKTNAEILENCPSTLTCCNEHTIITHESKPTRHYIVRRLIPIECARLQGFPDWWGIPDYKTEMTDEEKSFWHEVRRVYASVNGKKYKKSKDNALLNWYNKLHTDSAEYKMWGNGVCLLCAEYVVGGVVEAIANS